MQVQIKKQLKVELDQQDIIEAVGDYLLKNDIHVPQDELNEINFVKSPRDGLRATLNITEETGAQEETETGVAVKQAEPEPDPVEEETVVEVAEDVVPSLDEIATMVAEPAATEAVAVPAEEEEAVAPATETRSSLFK